MQKAKETASNIAASAKAGMDKTKAVVQEKVDKMTAHDPIEKGMATQRKEERITQAEINKQQTREHNAATTGHTTVPGTGGMATTGHHTGLGTGTGIGGTHTQSATGAHGLGTGTGIGGTHTHSATGAHGLGTGTGIGGTHTHSATGAHGHSTGGHQMSAMPGHGPGQPIGGHVVEGAIGSHPIGTVTGTGNTAENARAGANPANPTGYGTGTGGTYS